MSAQPTGFSQPIPVNRMLAGPSRHSLHVMLVLDGIGVSVAYWAAFAVRLGLIRPPDHYMDLFGLLLPVLPIIAVGMLFKLGLYGAFHNSLSQPAINRLLAVATIVALPPALLAFLWPSLNIPRSVPFIFMVGAGAFLIANRSIIYPYVFASAWRRAPSKEPVIIYGAGAAGRELAEQLERKSDWRVVAFVDDDSRLQGTEVAGKTVYHPDQIPETSARFGVRHVLVALSPSRDHEFYMLI